MTDKHRTSQSEIQCEQEHRAWSDEDVGPVSGRRPLTRGAPAYTSGDSINARYDLIRPLGQGGMATVWVGYDRRLEVHIALKLLRADNSDEQLEDRLLGEARAAAKLGHSAIVRVTDFARTTSGDPFLAMELLDGEDLAAMLRRKGRIGARTAVRLLLPIAHALAAAHETGIVHRDLKPENIFISRTSGGQLQPKLLDFGIAKRVRKGFDRITTAGTTLGSPGYMSPEQARGEEADQRTDVWALCVVLYELLTGRRPFRGKNYNALLRSVIEDTPVPITDLIAGDQRLWTIIEYGLRKPLGERWASMWDLGHALANWSLENGIVDDVTGTSLAVSWLQTEEQKGSSATVPPEPARGPSDSGAGVSGRSRDHVETARGAVVEPSEERPILDAESTPRDAGVDECVSCDAAPQPETPTRGWTKRQKGALAVVVVATAIASSSLATLWMRTERVGPLRPYLSGLTSAHARVVSFPRTLDSEESAVAPSASLTSSAPAPTRIVQPPKSKAPAPRRTRLKDPYK